MKLHEHAEALKEAHGGVWGHHPKHSVSAWQLEVENDDTRLGYWEWVAAQIEQEEGEEDGQ